MLNGGLSLFGINSRLFLFFKLIFFLNLAILSKKLT